MQWVSSLEAIYKCAICWELMTKPVSANPCGHEFDEDCIKSNLKNGDKKCPVCRLGVNSLNPAYTSLQAIETLQQIALNSTVVINIHSLNRRTATVVVQRNTKVAKLFPQLREKLGFSSLQNIKLTTSDRIISPFKSLLEYTLNDTSEYTFYATEYLGHWTDKAKDHLEIFDQANEEARNKNYNSNALGERFLNLYEKAFNKALCED